MKTKHYIIASAIALFILLSYSHLSSSSQNNDSTTTEDVNCNLDSLHSKVRKLAANLVDNDELLAEIKAIADCIPRSDYSGDYLDKAALALAISDYDNALIHLDNGLIEFHDNKLKLAEVFLYKGIIYALQNKLQFAKKYFYQSMALKGLPEPLIAIGFIIRESCSVKPDTSIFFNDCLMDAIDLFERASESQYAYEAWYNQTLAYIPYFNYTERYIDTACEFISKALEFKPDDSKAWLIKGGLLSHKCQFEEEIKCYDSAIKYLPEIPKLKNDLDSAKWYIDKDYHYRKHFNTLCFSLISRQRALFANTEMCTKPYFWYERGLKLERLYLIREAAICYHFATKQESNKYKSWTREGIVSYKLESFGSSLECYNSALALNPQYDTAWNYRGLVLTKLNRLQEASDSYDKALEINPEYADAWFNKGSIQINFSDNNKAIECFKKATKYNPNNVMAWFRAGNLLLSANEKNRNKEAIKYLKKALEFMPDNAEIWYDLYMAYKRLGRDEEAAACWDSCQRIAPGYGRMRIW